MNVHSGDDGICQRRSSRLQQSRFQRFTGFECDGFRPLVFASGAELGWSGHSVYEVVSLFAPEAHQPLAESLKKKKPGTPLTVRALFCKSCSPVISRFAVLG